MSKAIKWEIRNVLYTASLFVNNKTPNYEEFSFSISLDRSESDKYIIRIIRDYDEDTGDLCGITVYEKKVDSLAEAKLLVGEYVRDRFWWDDENDTWRFVQAWT